jgi:uncharacterized membrane protein
MKELPLKTYGKMKLFFGGVGTSSLIYGSYFFYIGEAWALNMIIIGGVFSIIVATINNYQVRRKRKLGILPQS